MKVFETDKKENLNSKLKRFTFNFFPAYRRTGARISFISDDWHEVHIRLKLKWSTKNYMGTMFGGSVYGSSDPVYVIQLIMILGKEYIVWDKSASVKFVKPIRQKIYAKFLITPERIQKIIEDLSKNNEIVIELQIHFIDEHHTVFAEVNKQIYIANKEYYRSKKLSKNLEN